MPIFREDVKLGTKVPLIREDDLSDGCVTTGKIRDGAVTEEKLADGIVDHLGDKVYDIMSGKFLPLEGGEMKGPIKYNNGTTISIPGIIAKSFIRLSPLGGLMADDGSIYMAMGKEDIDKLFNE